MESTQQKEPDDTTAVDAAIARLMEHFDTAQVFVSRVLEDGNTRTVVKGSGNYHARVNQAREFVTRDDELTREDSRKEN